MADNLTTTTTLASIPTSTVVATDKVTYSGDADANIAPTSLVHILGSEGSKTAASVSKLEDDAHSSGDPGIQALAVRKDTAASIPGSDGDYSPLQVNATGALRVEVANVSANSSVRLDDDVFTPAVDYVAVIGAQADETAPDSVNEGDAGALRMTLDRLLKVTNELESSAMRIGGVQVTPKFAVISSTGSGDTIALVSAKKLRVISLAIVLAGASTVKFQSGASTDKTGAMSFAANGGISLPFNPAGWFETIAGEKLNHVLGTSVGIAGMLSYIEV